MICKFEQVTNPCPWKPTIDTENGNQAFMPKSFEKAIVEGCFDKAVKIIAGCTSEEGLILSCQFEKSPWAPLILFNREFDNVTLEDITKAALIRNKFFPEDKDDINTKAPILKGNWPIQN